jgi:hypothetical protein
MKGIFDKPRYPELTTALVNEMQKELRAAGYHGLIFVTTPKSKEGKSCPTKI